jgi:hypothetical protein
VKERNLPTSIKSLPFCMTPSSASLSNIRALLPQSRDYSCYVSRPLLASPPLCLQKHSDILTYAHTIPRTLPTCDIRLGSLTLPASEAGDFVELILLYCRSSNLSGSTCSDFTATRVLCLLTKSRLSPAVGCSVIYYYILSHIMFEHFSFLCGVILCVLSLNVCRKNDDGNL